MTTTATKHHVQILPDYTVGAKISGFVLAIDAWDAVERAVAALGEQVEVGDIARAYSWDDHTAPVAQYVYGPIPELDGEMGWAQA